MGAFVSSLYEKDTQRFSRSLQDLMVEPMRNILIPKFQEMKQAVRVHQGLAFGISGSGPTVFAICKVQDHAQTVLTALEDVYAPIDIPIDTHINAISKTSGARILD